jgi:uncharacterized membrane protein
VTANAGTTRPSHRLPAIDLVRGLVMVVMVLDHARDFVHRDGLAGDPTDPSTTTPALFFTRWITHFCAPTFVFLAGLSVRLQLQRGADPAALGRATLRRGVQFVLLELVVLRPLMWFQLDYALLAFLQVIWAIGWGMVGLGVLLRWPGSRAAIAPLAVAIVAGHNLLEATPFSFAGIGSLEAVHIVLFGRGGIAFGDGGPVAVAQYAIVPWLGVMLLGFAAGRLFALLAERRRRWLVWLGALGCGAFVLLRSTHGYGDPTEWHADATSGWRTVFAFLRVEKYPPSLQYCLMTLGPMLLLLAAAERVRGDGRLAWIVRLGKAPLFFYVLQWPLVHLVSRLFQWLDGQPIGWDAPNIRDFGQPLPEGCGFSLPVVYLAWALGLAVLVPLTLWWERRQGRPRPA